MALRDEQADILGGPILQRPEISFFSLFSQHYSVFKVVALLGLGLLVWIACVRGYEQLKKSRELGYRKAMRRKHGIPDSDCRPFAVAYPAAKHARAEREAQERKKTTNHVSNHLSPALDQRTNVLIDAHGLRRRVAETTVQLYEHHLLPGRRPVVNSPNSADRYNPNARYREVIETVQEPPSIARKDIYINDDATEESRKRSFVDESDVEFETMKKSRIDGDEQADWYAQYTETRPRRESKGSYDLRVESNYVYMNGQERPSHINDLRDEDHEPADEAMGDADEDEVTELRTVPRGKKRDRIEAGSTFGGDDEEDAENSKSTHHRKRRTISRRKSEITTRGKKRDREAESPQSEGEGDGSESSRSHVGRTSRKKRGKKATSDGGSNSLVDPRVSKEPLCGGRRIGEEWEAEGVQYKVGDKGERLRLALLKKARNKYPMPKDSQHPDRSAALEIYVETWMTEEQYREAEERQKLAWQEAPRTSDASKTPDILESPTKSGKDLLWDSVKGSPARRPFRQSMTASPATRINPFQQSQSQPALGRRVASSSVVVSPVLSGIAGSPTRPGFRGFSKWEKQDREAEALAKIRAKMEEQKKAQTPLPEPSGMPTSVTAPELGGKTLTVPTITFTPAPPPSTQARSDKGPAATESKPATSAFSFATPSTTDSTKPTAVPASTATPSFSLPSAAVPTAPPSTPFPSTPTAVPTTQTIIPSTPSLPFAKLPPAPSATASTATATPSTSSIPNFFAKPAIATTPATTMPAPPSPFTLGATTQAQPPSTIATPKPSPFSFARPSTAPSTLTASAVVPAPSTAKSQLSIFGAASNTGASSSAPTPVAPTSVFGSTPAAIKAETPAFTTATPSDSSKPAAPLFSFSGASSTTPASTTPSAPRFSFGQPSTTSAFAPASTSTTSATSQPKPTSFKFGQISTAPTDGVSTSTPVAADESKKSIVPVSVFGATATLKDEVAKPSPFGGASSAFGGSAFAASSSTNIFGKPASAGGNASTSIPSTIPTFSSSTSSNPFSTTPAGSPASGGAPTNGFSFSGGGSGSKPAEGSKPSSIFGGSTDVFGGARDASKPTSVIGSTTFGASSSTPTFMFGKKDDVGIIASASAGSAQTKPAATFMFGAPPATGGSAFGQPSTSATNGDSTQPVFGKPANATPSAFGFGSSSSANIAFGKPTGQNQKQEQ